MRYTQRTEKLNEKYKRTGVPFIFSNSLLCINVWIVFYSYKENFSTKTIKIKEELGSPSYGAEHRRIYETIETISAQRQ